jgi:arginine decarboxylase
MINFGINKWGNNDFIVEDSLLKINHLSKPSFKKIIDKSIKDYNFSGPILLLFPHLIKKQIKELFNSFNKSIKEISYNGHFKAVFPLKVNQSSSFIKSLLDESIDYEYGFEAGSKPELVLAMRFCRENRPIIINGFKDEELIKMVFLAKNIGHDITIVIEGLNELDSIIKIYKDSHYKDMPNIGFRIRLHSLGDGNWAKSSGIHSKFGLTSTEILEAVNILEKNGLLDILKMVHFHIGSQINTITPFKKAIREIGNIYAELRKIGATSLDCIDIGGGLNIEYSQHSNDIQKNYTITEFSNDVIYLIKEISNKKCVKDPDILIESGRFIASSHCVLVARTLELFSDDIKKRALNLKSQNPPLIEELNYLYNNITKNSAREYLHDSLDHMESLLTLFDLGYIDLQDRSNTEILVNLLVKKSIQLLKDKHYKELLSIKDMLQEKYLLNFSIFQSLPDLWAINQNFPIIPLDKLDEPPTRNASIFDITCDSDGEIEFDNTKPLYLHEVNLEDEDYYIGFFLVGAYQESLGAKHNLFAKPNSVVVEITENDFILKESKESNSINKILTDMDYDIDEFLSYFYNKISKLQKINNIEKKDFKNYVFDFLKTNSYLR